MSESLRERIEALRKVLDDGPSNWPEVYPADLRRVASELVDSLAAKSNNYRRFWSAWEEACLVFGRFGETPSLLTNEREACARVCDEYAAKCEQKAQRVRDDSDRADGEAQEQEADELDGTATAVRLCAELIRNRTRCTGYADTIGRQSQVRCGLADGHDGPHEPRRR